MQNEEVQIRYRKFADSEALIDLLYRTELTLAQLVPLNTIRGIAVDTIVLLQEQYVFVIKRELSWQDYCLML
jgi:hypothetical protein